MRVRCRQCTCSLVENPSFKSSKCNLLLFPHLGCGKQMKNKGKRPDGIVFTNADPRYAGKLDDPQGGDATMLMQQVRSHDGQSRDDRRIKFDVANVGADGGSVAVRIRE